MPFTTNEENFQNKPAIMLLSCAILLTWQVESTPHPISFWIELHHFLTRHGLFPGQWAKVFLIWQGLGSPGLVNLASVIQNFVCITFVLNELSFFLFPLCMVNIPMQWVQLVFIELNKLFLFVKFHEIVKQSFLYLFIL